LNYFEIGQRIRRFRKAQRLSQEQLAERISISTTHMSHIETGNTKLSLAVLIDIACALDASLDDLVFGEKPLNRAAISGEINDIFDSCSERDARILTEIIKASKRALELYQ